MPKNTFKPSDTDQSDLDAAIDKSDIKTRRILKKKDFMDRAIDKSGIKKADAKAGIDAALAVLAEALANGDDLILPPLGKLKVTREKANPKGRILILRLQLIPAGASDVSGGSEPLAEAAD
jgi:hypothetical protein